MMSVEIMLNAANINLVAFASHLDSLGGQIMALFVIAIAAGEAAVGLAIIIVVFRGKRLTGIAVATSDTTKVPIEELREVQRVLDPPRQP